MSTDLTWLESFLPILRCPATQQTLRWATEEEKNRHSIQPTEKALASESGDHFYPISDGIPILLPP